MKPCQYHIHNHQNHLAWDNSLKPICTIESGETVSFSCDDASNGQVLRDSTVEAIKQFNFASLDQVNGPIFVNSAEPGDVLEVEFLEIETADWGNNYLCSTFGVVLGKG